MQSRLGLKEGKVSFVMQNVIMLVLGLEKKLNAGSVIKLYINRRGVLQKQRAVIYSVERVAKRNGEIRNLVEISMQIG